MIIAILVVVVVIVVVVAAQTHRKREQDLSGKVVLLTGAGGGFGRLLALGLARRGCLVACVDVAPKPNEETVKLVLQEQKKEQQQQDATVGARGYTADLSSREDIAKLVQQVIEDFGHVDILVSNAGQLQGGCIWDLSEDQIDLLLDVNLRASILLVRHLIPHMKARRSGHIVVTSSQTGIMAGKQISVYAATKAGLSHYMACLYQDLYAENLHNDIHLTTLQPWFMTTFNIVADSVRFKSWIGRKLFSAMEAEKCAETSVNAIAARRNLVNMPPFFAFLFHAKGIFPWSWQGFINENTVAYEPGPIVSYQKRHMELDPEYLHELLSKGYSLDSDPVNVCGKLNDDYLAKKKPLPYDYAKYSKKIVDYYKSRHAEIPHAVRCVFGLAAHS